MSMEFTLGTLELGGFCMASFFFYNSLKQQQSLQNSIEFMQKATVFTPALIKKVLEEGAPQSYLKSISRFSEGKHYSLGDAFVRGYVGCNRPLKSSINKNTRMILSHISTESIFSNNNKMNEGDGVIETRLVNEFKLAGDGSEEITVVNNMNTDFQRALTFVDSATHVRSLTGLEKFLSWALFCVKLFLSMSNVGKRISGFRVGSRKIERGILLGQMIVVYGKVFYDRINKQLRIDNPKFLLDNKFQLVRKMKKLSLKCSRNMALMSFLMSLMGVMFIRRVKRNLTEYLKKVARQKELRRLDKLYKISELITEDFKCICCKKIARNVVLKPCLHMAVCSLCAPKVVPQRCPICKKRVEDQVVIYVA
jgi:E3 ubiquitin-protein ligase MUL1